MMPLPSSSTVFCPILPGPVFNKMKWSALLQILEPEPEIGIFLSCGPDPQPEIAETSRTPEEQEMVSIIFNRLHIIFLYYIW